MHVPLTGAGVAGSGKVNVAGLGGGKGRDDTNGGELGGTKAHDDGGAGSGADGVGRRGWRESAFAAPNNKVKGCEVVMVE